ncbi:E3 ubiquitin-protein ligase MARCH6 [Wickerhamiella sorbophila]|uniref:RING-type E3 ubiquitin transferase n=1 Tax=Wickerhamiella sorbophila TaxID=45607 RepID=A0A2T0FEY3_9ASCO|nr:E3 ubiquitin-protein ligase MARCH6 [Wickerhamiella sorbophila]PRT53530.1 E3 ubiquitin-protein ligase MARCH6 [Wickerhamiella sorbophila]
MDEVCRICRSEATDDEPLYHPCRCSGSIKYVHQDCLLEWLKHSSKGQYCELCHTKYTFTSVYEPDMPEKLPVTAHIYHFLTLVRRGSRYASMLIWIHIWYLTLAITLKYELEFSTIYGNNLHRVMPHYILQIFLSKLGREPVFEAAWPYSLLPNEIQHATVRGTFALIALIFTALILITVSAWTTEDPFFRHEIEHLQDGEVGPMEVPDLADNVGDAPVPQNAAENDEDDNGLIWGPAPADPAQDDGQEDWDNVDDLFEAGNDEDDGEGVLREIWINAEAFVGAPWGQQIVEIVSTVVKLSVMVVAFYGCPHALGRLHIHAAMYVPAYLQALWNFARRGPVDLEASLSRVFLMQVPEAVPFEIMALVLGYIDIAMATYFIYRQFFQVMLSDESYRGVLVSMVYVLSTMKVLCVVVVEMISFPIFCGINFHIAIFPLVDVSWRVTVEYVKSHPYQAAVSYWASGLLYMSVLAGFLSVCRKFLRPGVLYFVQDPSDPRYQPVRTILMNGLIDHLRKVLLSAVMYTFLIVGGIGSVCTFVRFILPILYPVNLGFEFTWDLLQLWPFAGMLLIQYRDGAFSKKRWARILRMVLPVFFRRSADLAGIRHFLFADAPKPPAGQAGKFVRAPSNDYFKMRKNLELFVPVTPDDKRLDGVEGLSERELQKYTLVWRPSYFWARIAFFMVSLWAMLACSSCLLVFLPLFVGRMVSNYFLSSPVTNSSISLLVGQAVMWGIFKYHQQFLHLKTQMAADPLLAYRIHTYTLVLGLFADQCLNFPQILPPAIQRAIVTSHVPVASYVVYGIPLLFWERANIDPITREQLRGLIGSLAKLLVGRTAFMLLLPRRLQQILAVDARAGFLLLAVYAVLMRFGVFAYISEWNSRARESYYSRGVQLINLREN